MFGFRSLSIFMFIFSVVAIYIMYLKGENESLKVNLDRYINIVKVYEKNKKLDNKLQEIKQEMQIKKDEVVYTHTKLEVETCKRGDIKESAKNKNSNNNNNDFSIISF